MVQRERTKKKICFANGEHVSRSDDGVLVIGWLVYTNWFMETPATNQSFCCESIPRKEFSETKIMLDKCTKKYPCHELSCRIKANHMGKHDGRRQISAVKKLR